MAAVALGGVVLGLYASTISDDVALGDAPESVAGVASTGILHAPGYPTYVILGRLFSLLVPIGDITLRVNLFSAVCSSATVALTYMLARRLGADRLPAGIGALGLATGMAFWFYAGFAKHYALSGLLLAAATYLVVSAAQVHGSKTRRLVAAGGLLGLMAGASWQLAVLAVPGILVIIWSTRPSRRALTLAVIASAVSATAVYSFVLMRASQDPRVNWGDARTIPALIRLVMMEDYGRGTRTFEEGGHSIGAGASLPNQMLIYSRIYATELGIVMVLLAILGIVLALRWPLKWPGRYLVVAITTNTVVAALFVGIWRFRGADTALIVGGFLTGAVLPIVIAASLGITALAALARRWAPEHLSGLVSTAFSVLLGGLILTSSIASHAPQLRRRDNRFAEQYAENILMDMPDDGILLIWNAERAFPVDYQQIVRDARPDVDVVAADGLTFERYRASTERRLSLELPPVASDYVKDGAAVVRALSQLRPVRLDLFAALEFQSELGYRVEGILAEPVQGPPGAQPGGDPQSLEAAIARYELDGIYSDPYRLRWPNVIVNGTYVRMHLEAARVYVEREDWDSVERHLRAAERLSPEAEIVQQNLTALEQRRAAAGEAGGA
jgi:hypothetical protein